MARISEPQIYRPKPVELAKPKELRAGNFVWFGAGLVLVGLASFGYPAVRGRLERAVADLHILRFARRAKNSSEKIRLDTAAVLHAMEMAGHGESEFETQASACKVEAEVSDSPGNFADGTAVAEPVANSSNPPEAPATKASVEPAPKLEQPATESVNAPPPKPRASPSEESAEAKERRLVALKERLGIPPLDSANSEPPKGETPNLDVSAPQSGTCSPEGSSTGVPSAS